MCSPPLAMQCCSVMRAHGVAVETLLDAFLQSSSCVVLVSRCSARRWFAMAAPVSWLQRISRPCGRIAYRGVPRCAQKPSFHADEEVSRRKDEVVRHAAARVAAPVLLAVREIVAAQRGSRTRGRATTRCASRLTCAGQDEARVARCSAGTTGSDSAFRARARRCASPRR